MGSLVSVRRHLLPRLVSTVAMMALVALAVSDLGWLFSLTVVATAAGAVMGVYALFPKSSMFSIAFANLIGIYACLFHFFVMSNFSSVRPDLIPLGFVMPVIAFLLGCWRWNDRVQDLVARRAARGDRALLRELAWLLPVFTIGLGTFFLPRGGDAPSDIVFLAAMAGISLIVHYVGPSIAAFMVDSGLLFDEFFARARQLVVPAFAFMTFYSLVVIVFGALYRVIDQFSPGVHFLMQGEPHDISLTEAIYYSVVTLGTVGYGDIVPVSDIVRGLAVLEVISGVLLILFGFSEILAYSKERQK